MTTPYRRLIRDLMMRGDPAALTRLMRDLAVVPDATLRRAPPPARAADLAGVHVSSIRRWEASGRITPVRMRRGARELVLIRAADMAALGFGATPPSPTPAVAAPCRRAPASRLTTTG